MKKFVFKLASVRHQREVVRDREQQRLAELLDALDRARQQLDALERELVETQQRTMGTGAPIEAKELRLRAQYLERLRGRIQTAQNSIASLERELAQQRQRAIEAEQNLKMLDKLGERQRAAHQQAACHEAQIEADEMSLLRLARSRRS